MGKYFIYGAGAASRKLYPQIKQKYGEITCFFDENPERWGTEQFGVPIINPREIRHIHCDKIVVASVIGYEEIVKRLKNEFNIPEERMDISFSNKLYETTLGTRERFISSFSKIVYTKKLKGSVAEGGVFEESFAKRINALFPDRTIYLFDTFNGFDAKDVTIEIERNFSSKNANYFNSTFTADKIKSILPHPEQAVIRQGYFPETAEGITDHFVFVNLDFDLYQPTIEGLNFFFPKLVHGGVILIHDYFNPFVLEADAFNGIKQAVEEFCSQQKIAHVPIADEMSVAIVKY